MELDRRGAPGSCCGVSEGVAQKDQKNHQHKMVLTGPLGKLDRAPLPAADAVVTANALYEFGRFGQGALVSEFREVIC